MRGRPRVRLEHVEEDAHHATRLMEALAAAWDVESVPLGTSHDHEDPTIVIVSPSFIIAGGLDRRSSGAVPLMVEPTDIDDAFGSTPVLDGRDGWIPDPGHLRQGPIVRPPPPPEYERVSDRATGLILAAAARCVLSGITPPEALEPLERSMRYGPRLHVGEVAGGRFRLVRRLGESPTLSTWLATDLLSEHPTIVRVFHGPGATDPQARGATAEMLGRCEDLLGVPDLCEAQGDHRGFPFVALGMAPGNDLDRAVQDALWTPERALQAVLDAAEILDAAHQKDVFHGTLRPRSIVSGPQGTFVVDLGLGSAGAQDMRFMAPEARAPDARPTAAADVFALARCAIFALRGDVPPWADEEPERLLAALPILGPLSAGALRDAMRWDPEARPASAAALAQQILSDQYVLNALSIAPGSSASRRVQHLIQLVEHTPDVETRMQLATLQLDQDDHAAATEQLLAAAEDPDIEPEQMRTALDMLTLTTTVDEHGAVEALQRIAGLEHGPGPSTLMITAARIASLHGPSADAWRYLLASHHSREQAMEALRALADLAEEREDWDEYCATTTQLAAYVGAEEATDLLTRVARIHWERRSSRDEALALLRALANSGRDTETSREMLNSIEAGQGGWRSAVQRLQQAASHASGSAAAHHLAEAAEAAAYVDLDDADLMYEEVLSLDPTHAGARRFLAQRAELQGDPAGAATHYAALLDADDPPLGDILGHATCLAAVDRLEEAHASAERAVAIAPHHPEAVAMLVTTSLGVGDLDQAERVSLDLNQLVRHGLPASLGLARAGHLALWRGDVAEAAVRFDAAHRADPTAPEPKWGKALVALWARQEPTAGHPAWITTTPPTVTGQEAVARLLHIVADPESLRHWVEDHSLGRFIDLDELDELMVACIAVQLANTDGAIGSGLFQSLSANFSGDLALVRAASEVWNGAGANGLADLIQRGRLLRGGRPDLDPHASRAPIRGPAGAGWDAGVWSEMLVGRIDLPEERLPPTPRSVVAALVSGGNRWPLAPGHHVVGGTGSVDVQVKSLGGLRFAVHHTGHFVYVSDPYGAGMEVDGSRASEARVTDGSMLRVGTAEFRVEVGPRRSGDHTPLVGRMDRIDAVRDALIEMDDLDAPEAWVEVNYSGESHRFALDAGPVVIGRRSADDVVVSEFTGRSFLWRVTQRNGRYYLDDCASTTRRVREFAPGEVVTYRDVCSIELVGAAESEEPPDHLGSPVLNYPDGSLLGALVDVSPLPFRIGSDPDCHLHIPDRDLAPVHCVIDVRDGTYVVVDVGSDTGTRLDGNPVDAGRLQHDSAVSIGTVTLTFRLVEHQLRREEPFNAERDLFAAR